MDAYFSGTDDANENMTQFYGVYGKIKDEQPKFAFRFVSGESKIKYDPSILFDFPQVKITTTVTEEFIGIEDIGVELRPTIDTIEEYENFMGPWPKVEYPDDWMDQHAKSITTVRSYGYTYGRGDQTRDAGRTGYGEGRAWDWDDYYDGAYGGHYANYQSESKKNELEDDDTEVETSSAVVQIQAEDIINSMAMADIKTLVHELCDYGYDYIIAEALEEQKFIDRL